MCTRDNALADARAKSLRTHARTMQQLLHVLKQNLRRNTRGTNASLFMISSKVVNAYL